MLTRALLRSLSVTALLITGFAAGWLSSSAVGVGAPLPSPIAGLFGAGVITNQASPAAIRDQFAVFWEVWDLLDQEYYGRAQLNRTTMIQGAIKGMLASLDDQYTVYQEPDLAEQTQDHLQGKLGGIGTYLRITDGRAFLYKPFQNGPAFEAGLRQDDELARIDGEDIPTLIAGLSVDEAAVKVAAKLRGPEGSQVVLSIRRAADGALTEVTLIRRDIVVPSVEAQQFDDGIAYLRIAEFKGNTTQEFDAALADLLAASPRGIILDLRNNPGGLLTSAQEVLGRFYDGVALYEENGVGGEKELHTIAGGRRIPEVPLVVIVNGGSASASEIVAGALIERRPNTVLLGEKSFGKGSVQNIHTLRDGGNARITFAHWLTPEKHIIHGMGLTPRYVVAFADDPGSLVPCVADRQPPPGASLCGDTQLAAALRFLKDGQ